MAKGLDVFQAHVESTYFSPSSFPVNITCNNKSLYNNRITNQYHGQEEEGSLSVGGCWQPEEE